MKKISVHQKRWNKIKADKKILQLRKKNRKRFRRRKSASGEVQNYNGKKVKTLHAPKQFSLVEDQENATLTFFDHTVEVIEKSELEQNLYFDFHYVENVSADAIMYMIAIIWNYKRVRTRKIRIRGNLPRDDAARRFIEDIGFYSYVMGPKTMHQPSSERFRISGGNSPDGKLVGELCDFVNCCSGNIRDTKRLYPMLIELMTNTCQHAYDHNMLSKMRPNWYVFAEKNEKLVHFVFLDTGLGIPETIRYTIRERGENIFGRDDAAYISSALRGENRTETKRTYRGKGLPGIYKDVEKNKILDLSITSGNGKCIIKSGSIIEETLDNHFEGTLFSWNFSIA